MKFESEDGGTTVECAYDSMGRRFEKKVTVGGTTGFHARYPSTVTTCRWRSAT
ncbi:hypothetical protein [Akkermansia muciniphila]|uniref:hypothetical protein n=1 Tax=Akkermansia muciniphila TaxID=239935 RepID=UPI0015E157A3|nr:hypothetical protein [Akkermansia muciniphila]